MARRKYQLWTLPEITFAIAQFEKGERDYGRIANQLPGRTAIDVGVLLRQQGCFKSPNNRKKPK